MTRAAEGTRLHAPSPCAAPPPSIAQNALVFVTPRAKKLTSPDDFGRVVIWLDYCHQRHLPSSPATPCRGQQTTLHIHRYVTIYYVMKPLQPADEYL